MESDPWQPDGTAALEFLQALEGTPYRGNRRQPGKAIDCINLVMATLEAAGVAPSLRTQPHPGTVGHGIDQNPIGGALAAIFHSDRIAVEDWQPRPADVVIFGVGRWAFHCAIIAGNRLWHVTESTPVHHCSIDAHLRRFQEIIRITGPGTKIDPESLNLA